MQLWTIQSESAWRSLNQVGYLRGRRKVVDRDYLPAYDWIASQMRSRIGPPPSNRVSVPIWAWYQYDGVGRQRPDLRASGHLPRGTRGYRIAFTIADELAVLSDFELWHYVLNYWYLPSSEADDDKFNERLNKLRCSWSERSRNQDVDRTIRDSWSRIFDLTWCDPNIAAESSRKSIQATLWRLELSMVTAVDAFVAR